MQKKKNILIADDHEIFRRGLVSSLRNCDFVKEIFEAKDGNEVLEITSSNQIDLLLLDIKMPELNGIEVTEKLTKENPGLPILILTMHGEENFILTMIEKGAKGYLLKDTSREELISAIEATLEGSSYFSQEVANKIVKSLGRKSNQLKPGGNLTKREKEILGLIAKGFTNTSIAGKLFISPRTVDTHRRNLLQKSGASNTAGLVNWAYKNNYLAY